MVQATRPIFRGAFLAACLALLCGPPSAAQPAGPKDDPDARRRAVAEDVERLKQIVDTLALREAEDAARRLLEQQGETPAAVTVLLFAEAGRWTARYTDSEDVFTDDGSVTLPVGESIDLRHTAADIIYDMRADELGLTFEAIPGRIGAVRLRASKSGMFDANCQLCGAKGAPLRLRIVSQDEFESWLAHQKTARK